MFILKSNVFLHNREAAFVGISHSSSASEWANLLPTFFVSYSTAFSLLVHALAVPIVALTSRVIRKRDELQTRLTTGWYYLLFFHAVRVSSDNKIR